MTYTPAALILPTYRYRLGFVEFFVYRGGYHLNKNQLQTLKESIQEAILERRTLGEYNADSKHMLFLLTGLLETVEHAISQLPKTEKKKS